MSNRRGAVAVLATLLLVAVGCASPAEPDAVAVPTPIPTTTVTTTSTTTLPPPPAVTVGAEVLADSGFAALDGARVGLIANQTSLVRGVHLIDVLDQAPNVQLVSVFAPEHGVRGTAGAGALIDDEVDSATGTPIFSLYGATRAPTPEMLQGIDVLVYDLQDVGGRFYTFISTMGLAMQAAAEAGVRFMVLDRPDPSGGVVVSGYVLEPEQVSFIGQYPIPAAYAMTPGELALAIVGEGWLERVAGLDLEIVEMNGWLRGMTWDDTGLDWVPPSPGLQTPLSAVTYLGTVLLEATSISYGGGTVETFELVGAPWADQITMAGRLNTLGLRGVIFEPVSFTPGPLPGRTSEPRLKGELMEGVRIRVTDPGLFEPVSVGIYILDEFRRAALENEVDDYINRPRAMGLLAGTAKLVEALEAGTSAAEIVAGWAESLREFNEVRAGYLVY